MDDFVILVCDVIAFTFLIFIAWGSLKLAILIHDWRQNK
jgi:hypothetical protein